MMPCTQSKSEQSKFRGRKVSISCVFLIIWRYAASGVPMLSNRAATSLAGTLNRAVRIGLPLVLAICVWCGGAVVLSSSRTSNAQKPQPPLRFVAHLVLFEPKAELLDAVSRGKLVVPRLVDVGLGSNAFKGSSAGICRDVALDTVLPKIAPLKGFASTDPQKVVAECRRVDDRWNYRVVSSATAILRPGTMACADGSSAHTTLREPTSGAEFPGAVVWYRAAWVLRLSDLLPAGWVMCEKVRLLDKWTGDAVDTSHSSGAVREEPLDGRAVAYAEGARVQLWQVGRKSSRLHRGIVPATMLIEAFWSTSASADQARDAHRGNCYASWHVGSADGSECWRCAGACAGARTTGSRRLSHG